MINKVKCLQCGYEWIQRTEKPVKCPNIKCQSYFWDVPKAKGGN